MTTMMSSWSPWNFLWIILISTLTSGDNLALLSGTLRTYQKASCDKDWMSLQCPTGTTISVQLAQYGKNFRLPSLCHSQSVTSSHSDLHNSLQQSTSNVTCHWPPAIQYSLLQTVVGLCQKKSSCKFQTSPRTFGGDPCPGSRKYVEVAFKCRPSEFKSVIGCEDEVIQLKCNRSSRLAIYSANYGRTEYESVQCSQPNGVPEESCLSSYATETVMQMCHGKRKCALSADPATFGNPCKPESRMYLKVIYTCVPRKVLQEKYQGEPEPDEIFEAEETEDDVVDPSIIEQPSIYSPDHSKGWPQPKNTSSPARNSLSQASGLGPDDDVIVPRDDNSLLSSSSSVLSHDSHTGNNLSFDTSDESQSSQSGVRIVYLISQGINAYDFITKNPEKFYLYLAISLASVLLLIIVLILVKITIQRRRQNGRHGNNQSGGGSTKGGGTSKPSSSSAGPILSSGLSDIDDLSVDMEQTEMTFTELPSILKRSSPYDREHSNLRRDIQYSRPVSTVTGGTTTVTTTTLGRANEVVRFSNTLGRRDRDTNNPRSLKQESEHSEHFLYG